MKLINFSHSSIDSNEGKWEINDVIFQGLNLIAGKNAVGKSRTIDSLANLIKIIRQEKVYIYESDIFWEIELSDGKDSLAYYVRLKFQINGEFEVVEEKITYKGEDILKREDKSTQIKSISDGFKKIHPPSNRLVLHVRRDTIEYPYLEEICSWADNSHGVKFGKIREQSYIPDTSFNIFPMRGSIPNIYDLFTKERKENVIASLGKLGYNISSIEVITSFDNKKMLIIKEKDIKSHISERELSQGLLRSLYLLIFIEHIVNLQTSQLLMIDDLCEGLDYHRAVELGKIVFSLCEEKGIQLITTSNDAFLMDAIELDYLIVLRRKGAVITCINKENSPKLFEDFISTTGMGNFDFFSSDFLDQELKR